MWRIKRRLGGELWVAILGAVILGCAFFAPAVGRATTFTVEITEPTTQSGLSFEGGVAYDFAATAYLDGQPVSSEQVTWLWDFGDGSDPETTATCQHTYAAPGDYRVRVTAQYSSLEAADEINEADAEEVDAGVLIAVVPDAVCDTVTVECRVSGDMLFEYGLGFPEATFYKAVDGEWELQGVPAVWQERQIGGAWYSVAGVQWDTPEDKNAAYQWKVSYDILVLPGPPEELGHHSGNKFAQWTPDNTIVTSGTPPLIFHTANPQQHQIAWSLSHADYGPPDYEVDVSVYGLNGNLVWHTNPPQTREGPGSGSATWPGASAPGIYTFNVAASHLGEMMMPGCDGQEKSSRLAITILGFHWASKSPENGNMVIKARYHLNHDAGAATVHYYQLLGGTMTSLATQSLSGEHLQAGAHTSPKFQVDADFDQNGNPLGTYYAVVTATESAEDAAQNRDGVAKQALPKGTSDLEPGLSISFPPDLAKVVFNDFLPDGLCAIGCQGTANGIADDDDLEWDLEPIAGSVLTSDPDPPEGAYVVFTYEGLPSANDAFGPKKVELTHPEVEDSETHTVKVFFIMDAKNHPGAGAGVTPNWYYYWSQTSASYENHEYISAGLSHTDFDPGANQWQAYIADDAAATPAPPSAWDNAGGIDRFAGACRHEDRHVQLFTSWWPQGYPYQYMVQGGVLDTDADGIPNTVELGLQQEGYAYSPYDPVSVPDLLHYNVPERWNDNEDYTMRTQPTWSNGSANDDDWSMGGHQWW